MSDLKLPQLWNFVGGSGKLLPMRLAACLSVFICALVWPPSPLHADQAQLRILPQSELRFGSFAVPSRGSIEISPSGSVNRDGIISITSGDTAPARFVVRYDRGNNGRNRLDLQIQLIIAAPTTFVQGGITATLSRFQTDLPGYASIAPNQIIEIRMPNCLQRVCETSFNVGGRLEVDRRFGGAQVSVPILVDAVLMGVR